MYSNVYFPALQVNTYRIYRARIPTLIIPCTFNLAMSPVSGADLPPEVISAIASSLAMEAPHYKRGLAACSLTCRYWAGLIRPELFESLAVYAFEDLHRLIEFLDCPAPMPGPPLTQLVKSIRVPYEQCYKQPVVCAVLTNSVSATGLCLH